MSKLYFEIILASAFQKPLTYFYETQNPLMPLSVVRVPLKNKEIIGFVLQQVPQPNFETKGIFEILISEAFIPNAYFKLCQFISSYYYCSLGEALFLFFHHVAIIPKTLDTPLHTLISLPTPSPTQKHIFNQLKPHLFQYYTALIFGITGSGKTILYYYIIQSLLEKGKQVLVLIPEISLTEHLYDRFKIFFEKAITCTVIHSKIKEKEKQTLYKKIAEGEIRLIIGTRSALFSPFCNLGGIIVDEEHDDSYKSNQNPKYHAKTIASHLAKILNIPLILGSATPSLETFYAVKKGLIHLFRLNQRFQNNTLPDIQIIKPRNSLELIPNILVKEILQQTQRNNKILLFINRKGYSHYLFCSNCQYEITCNKCSSFLTYHKDKQILKCHYCDQEYPMLYQCPQCKNPLSQKSFGTEKIEDKINELFHNLNILRVDGNQLQKQQIRNHLQTAMKEADLLIGTQLLSKGLDFDNLTLVGVLGIDFLFNILDFRIQEKIFSLLLQISGRAGRKNKGKVFIETKYPDEPLFSWVSQNDYQSFFENEIQIRKKYLYPPFTKVIRILAKAKNKTLPCDFLKDLAFSLLKTKDTYQTHLIIIGPSACPIPKINYFYRFHFLIKTLEIQKTNHIITNLLNQMPPSHKIILNIDVDPVNFV